MTPNRTHVRQTEVLQSVKAGTFGEFVVLGSEYRAQSGELHWYIAVLCEGCPSFKLRHVLRGEAPEGLNQDESEAVVEAIWLWDSHPEPN
jgi:hypothetical protein